MVTSCCAYGCSYRHVKGNSVGMFRFPKDKTRLKAWVRAIRRKNWKPTAASRICGKHFQTGKPSTDEDHPDYVPNVFSFKINKNTAAKYERKKKREEKKKQQEAVFALLALSSVPDATDDADITDANGNVENMEEEPVDSHAELVTSLYNEIDALREKVRNLEEKNLKLDPTLGVLHNNKKLLLHTGLKSIDLFRFIIDVVIDEIPASSLTLETQLLIVLMKLKLNLLASYLASRFNVSESTIKRVFDNWIPVLAGKLRHFITWPHKKALKKNIPECFQNSEFRNTVCIIDCTEVPIEKASNEVAAAQTWSHYKQTQTIKFLVGMTPTGHISFLSEVWGGRVSDKQITLESGFLNKLNPGDTVLADRGFILNEHFTKVGAKLVVPSFVRGKKQLSKEEVYYSKKVSNVRIHVERVIKQIKRFRIFRTVIPIHFLKYIDSVAIICAALSNLSSGVV